MGQAIKDPAGKVLGYFLTHDEYRNLMDALVDGMPPEPDFNILKEQVRNWDGKSGKTTAEIMKIMEQWKIHPPEPTP